MLKNIKIKWRLGISFSLILILMITIILVSLNALKDSHEKLTRIVTVNNVRLNLANHMIDDTREVSITLRNALLLNNSDETQKMKGQIAEIRKQYDDNFKKFEELTITDDTTTFRLISEIKVLQQSSRQLNDNVLNLATEGKYDDAFNLMINQASPTVATWIYKIDELINHSEDRTILRYNEAKETQVTALTTMFILGTLSIVISVVIVIILTLGISMPLSLSVNAANRIASGDLTVDLSSAGKRDDEIGVMIQAFIKMIKTLRDQMQGIKEGVNTLASSSSEILASTTQIAAGTAETATSINETTATVEEVRQAAQLSSEKAKNVSDSAQNTVQVTKTGQKAVEGTISGMNHIREQMESIANTIVGLSEQSQLIGGIIASVNDIADQSNLLAVNAAIEASKAGELGKGFTVVAQEIKSLAEQSKKATAQVRNILSDIQKATTAAVMATEQGSNAVEAGVRQSMEAGESIRVLAESSNEALQATTQIAASSQQQVVGMDQIGLAMENINQAGTENAISMKQAETTAKDLHELGLKLKQIVEQYKI